MAFCAARLMNSGVGMFDSPKYSFNTPSIDMAISASSRMRECGTASAEAATAGLNLISGLDTLKDRRCWNAEAGKGGVGERLAIPEELGASLDVEDSHSPFIRIDHPNRFASM